MTTENSGLTVRVLDTGYVRLKDAMGDDLSPVNDAKVSYAKESEKFGPREARLLSFLGREGHTSPFRHSVMKFEVYAPLMVARQFWKYIIGSDHAELPFGREAADPFTAWNESSRRYITEEPEFYMVESDAWRSAPANSKQGSGENLPEALGRQLTSTLAAHQLEGERLYNQAMSQGVAPEQARLFLPAYGLMVRWVWTGSLQSVCHLLEQRLAHDSQWEFQQYAKAIRDLAKTQFPNAIDAYLNRGDEAHGK